ncbi:MAG TPA: hypothetical protein PKM97_07905 [Bacteroidia bacterium]|nr:hypothetical protein [Bacteroidia bacterium]
MKLDNAISDNEIISSIHRLREYIEAEEFKGYDPYDTLKSSFPFRSFGNWTAAIATQIQKRNPINLRPLLGIKKDYNPKGIGLLLHAYVHLQESFPEEDYSNQIGFLFNWLKENPAKGFSGTCWGYNFAWSGPGKHLPAFAPTVVATGFIAQAIHAYYLFSKNEQAKELLISIEPFITKDIPITKFDVGICFSYSPFMQDCCYNASLLAAETLASVYSLNKDESLKELAFRAVEFVVSKQHADGHWKYKIDPDTGIERHQVDFHQGYIIDSIKAIMELTGEYPVNWKKACDKGIDFYMRQQFFPEGRSKWRLPHEYPVEIHNQSQGIITCCKFNDTNNKSLEFASTVANWTIKEMQDADRGYFYYRKLKYYKNRLSFMRWSNAWMLLALAELILARKKSKGVEHA